MRFFVSHARRICFKVSRHEVLVWVAFDVRFLTAKAIVGIHAYHNESIMFSLCIMYERTMTTISFDGTACEVINPRIQFPA